MGASNTPLYDLIELSGVTANTTYTTASGGGGDILGLVDNATYTDSETGNSATEITEINDTADADNGVLTIDGVNYDITIFTPDSTNFADRVTVTYNNGSSSVDLYGDHLNAQVAWISATPSGGGTTRYFMVIQDDVGDLADITSVQVRGVDFNPAGDDVQINLDQNNNITVCFAAGTLIDTPTGPRPVEDIGDGDMVLTLDHGPHPVQWAARMDLPLDNAMRGQKNAPVRIQRGALGPGMPARDLIVSPQHRIMIASKIAGRMFGACEVLIPAKKLVGYPGIRRDRSFGQITYVHLFMGSHDVLWADGAPAESLLAETGAAGGLSARAKAKLERASPTPPARMIIEQKGMVEALLRRHRKNAKPLVDPDLVPRTTATPILRLASG